MRRPMPRVAGFSIRSTARRRSFVVCRCGDRSSPCVRVTRCSRARRTFRRWANARRRARRGCWWNGARCRVSDVATLREATVLTTDERFAGRRRAARRLAEAGGRAAVSRTWGDCYGYLLVATGRAEVMIDGSSRPWDAAALMPIIEEAGGVFTDWTGTRTAFGGSAMATNRGAAPPNARLLLGNCTMRDVHARPVGTGLREEQRPRSPS